MTPLLVSRASVQERQTSNDIDSSWDPEIEIPLLTTIDALNYSYNIYSSFTYCKCKQMKSGQQWRIGDCCSRTDIIPNLSNTIIHTTQHIIFNVLIYGRIHCSYHRTGFFQQLFLISCFKLLYCICDDKNPWWVVSPWNQLWSIKLLQNTKLCGYLLTSQKHYNPMTA